MLENTFTSLAAWFLEFLLSLGVLQFLADILLLAAKWGLIITLVTLDVIILIWLERKVSGFIQERPGPNRLGPAGLFQTIADTLKLMTKEDIIPGHVDRIVFMIAPLLFIIVAVMLYTVLPFGFDMAVVDMDMGLLFFLAVSSLSTICIFMAGWGSNNKWSLLGAMRSVAQMISYELPLVFSVLAIIMLTGSLRLYDVVAAQQNIWFVFLQPIAFVVYIVAATAELNRGPFDMPEAEQELVAGAFTEYTGMRWSLFFLAEYTNLVAVSALAVTLFLGGGAGPVLPSWLWLMVKVYLVMIALMFFKWTFPRMRMDHLMAFSWKCLIPISVANMLLTGAGVHFVKFLGW